MTWMRVAIVGGGIGGLAAANALVRAGVEVHVVEGADGIHSTLQQYVTEPSKPISSGMVAYRGLIAANAVNWPDGAMRNWLGTGKHFMVYPVRGGELLNYVGFVATDALMKES